MILVIQYNGQNGLLTYQRGFISRPGCPPIACLSHITSPRVLWLIRTRYGLMNVGTEATKYVATNGY